MDSLAQIHDDYELSAIGEPELDLETVEVPEQGPMTFEFDLEVRPQFDLPQWKGLQIEKPVREFTDADIDQALKRILTNRGRLVPVDGPAEPDDYITTNLTFKHGDQVLSMRRGGSHSSPPGAQLPRRQDRRFRQGHGRRPRRQTRELTTNSARCSQRGPSLPASHGRLRGARSQAPPVAGIDSGTAAGAGKLEPRPIFATRSRTRWVSVWPISSGSGPASRSPPR